METHMPIPMPSFRPIDAVKTDDEAMLTLNNAGYTNVSDLTQRSNGWVATAINPAGVSCEVIVLKSGSVSEDQLNSLDSEES